MNRKGYTFGSYIGSREWLTVPGSFYRLPELRATREEAERDLAAFRALHSTEPFPLETAEVVMIRHSGVTGGWAFKVME
jgi:hypothetical protein